MHCTNLTLWKNGKKKAPGKRQPQEVLLAVCQKPREGQSGRSCSGQFFIKKRKLCLIFFLLHNCMLRPVGLSHKIRIKYICLWSKGDKIWKSSRGVNASCSCMLGFECPSSFVTRCYTKEKWWNWYVCGTPGEKESGREPGVMGNSFTDKIFACYCLKSHSAQATPTHIPPCHKSFPVQNHCVQSCPRGILEERTLFAYCGFSQSSFAFIQDVLQPACQWVKRCWIDACRRLSGRHCGELWAQKIGNCAFLCLMTASSGEEPRHSSNVNPQFWWNTSACKRKGTDKYAKLQLSWLSGVRFL